MTKKLTLLHTSPVHVATFDRLLSELAPTLPVQHVVDESLLAEARAAGTITPHLAQRVSATILAAMADDSAVVLCTCSTIGGCAESVNAKTARPPDRLVVRVDRAMAEKAVELGTRIVVVAALASTLEPTRQLILETAHAASKSVTIFALLCEGAWAKFERGDHTGYHETIAACLRQGVPDADVIVLAQASMAAAALLCSDLPIPIVSSPRLGLAAAIRLVDVQA